MLWSAAFGEAFDISDPLVVGMDRVAGAFELGRKQTDSASSSVSTSSQLVRSPLKNCCSKTTVDDNNTTNLENASMIRQPLIRSLKQRSIG